MNKLNLTGTELIEANIKKHIVNMGFTMGSMVAKGEIERVDVHSEFEDFLIGKAIAFEINIEKLKSEYKIDDYYDLIDAYSHKEILEWAKSH